VPQRHMELLRALVPGDAGVSRRLAPEAARFVELARSATVVPVWREVLADTLTPVATFMSVVGDGPGFLLESVEHGERWSRWSFLGRNPLATLSAIGGEISLLSGAVRDSVPLQDGVLNCLEFLLAAYRSPQLAGLPPLHGGIVGYLGYDVVREIEHLPDAPPNDVGFPDAIFSVIGEVVAFDHWRQRAVLIDNVVVGPDGVGDGDRELAAAYEAAGERLDRLARDLRAARDSPPEPIYEPADRGERLPPEAIRRRMSSQSYRDAVAVAKEHIREGDAFQIVLAQRFDVDLGGADPFDVYRVLRQINPSPYMFFLRQGGVTVAGASPEPMVQLLGGRVVSRPIAGTRRRGETAEEDRQLGGELSEHPKEVAEHVMLVDLARNDVGRVARFATMQVEELMVLERYSHVMHLTSQVSGELAAGKGPVDVLRATLPAGTVSGAPKVRAMEIIDSLEVSRRGPYAGTIGYLDFSGNLDTAIAIRTLVVAPDGSASVQAGAGIVVDSDPAAEDEECINKAAAIFAAVAGAQRLASARRCRGRVSAPGPTWEALSSGVVAFDGRRDCLSVIGPDAFSFLQGQVSQEIDIPIGESRDTFVLSPQGKLVSFARVVRLADDQFLLDTEAGRGPELLERLKRFRLRVKAEISALPGWTCVSWRGPGAEMAAKEQAASLEGAVLVRWDWAGWAGFDLLGAGLVVPEAEFAVDCGAIEAARIAAGVPQMGSELTEKTIPQETGLVERAVSFEKGCYTGQELVARIDSRGSNVARRLRGVLFDDGEGDLPVAGAELSLGGALTSVALHPVAGVPIALAYVRRGVEVGDRGDCAGWSGVVRELPMFDLLPQVQ
jgi:anthranilate synthase component 1